MALSIAERLREIGLLRAVGMTQRHLRATVRGEAALITGLAVFIDVGTGLAFVAGIVRALGSQTPLPLVVPSGQLLAVSSLVTVGGLVAGLLRARRAARLDVLAAIASR